jgi:hypothetical protein
MSRKVGDDPSIAISPPASSTCAVFLRASANYRKPVSGTPTPPSVSPSCPPFGIPLPSRLNRMTSFSRHFSPTSCRSGSTRILYVASRVSCFAQLTPLFADRPTLGSVCFEFRGAHQAASHPGAPCRSPAKFIQGDDYQPDLIRTVQMGPWTHKVDDGLDARKTAYGTMYTLLDTCPSL